jgi:hypothetical protein
MYSVIATRPYLVQKRQLSLVPTCVGRNFNINMVKSVIKTAAAHNHTVNIDVFPLAEGVPSETPVQMKGVCKKDATTCEGV